MQFEALTEFCHKQLDKREHCCFGISPFNSYFSEDLIRQLALWGQREFKSMHFFVPDVPAVYTLLAQGYPLEKAEWKARRQAQYLKNKIRRALESLALAQDEVSEMILDWDKLISNPQYVALHDEVNDRFDSDLLFRSECLDASRWVLSQKTSDSDELTDEALLIAVKYFLAELPLFTDTARIVGRSSSAFCYHQRVRFLERFYERRLSYRPSGNQGFIVLSTLDPQTESKHQLLSFDQTLESSPFTPP